MRLIVDASVMMHKSWHCMFSDNYVPQVKEEITNAEGEKETVYFTETEEYTRNLAMNLLYLKNLYKPDDMVLCLDAPSNWRADYVREWYHERLEVFEQLEGCERPTFYVTFDRVEYRITYVSQTNVWNINKTKKADQREPSLEYKVWTYDEIKDEDVWIRAIQNKVPYYKGTRKNGNWEALTPKSEFKALSAELGVSLAPILGARSIMVDKAEGDDIVTACVIEANAFDPNETVVVVSIDQDLYQLATMHPNMKYYNPILREEIPLSADVARLKLVHKIVGGDGSDNIKGISLLGDKKAMPQVSYDAHGVVKSGKGTDTYVNGCLEQGLAQGKAGVELFVPVYEQIGVDAVIDTFYRNVTLVYLKNVPKVIMDEALEKVVGDEPKENQTKWSYFGVTGKDKISVINEANNDRKDL